MDEIRIIDFGSQYAQLIARRVREAGVYCEIFPYDNVVEPLEAPGLAGIILSGGPETATVTDAPRAPARAFERGVPVLSVAQTSLNWSSHRRSQNGCSDVTAP